MGIDIDSKFLVGLYYSDFPDYIKEVIETDYDGSVHGWNESHYNFDYASPYYDADADECFYGFSVIKGSVNDVIIDLELQEASFIATGLGDPVVYAGKHAW